MEASVEFGRNGRREAGFSLIELMIAIAILAIVLAIAVPNINQVIAAQRVRSVATELHSAFALARSEAQKRNADVRIVATTSDWSKGWKVCAGCNADGSSAGPKFVVLLEQTSLPNGITGTELPDATNTITYKNSGRVAETFTSLTIASQVTGASKRCLTLAVNGMPSTAAC